MEGLLPSIVHTLRNFISGQVWKDTALYQTLLHGEYSFPIHSEEVLKSLDYDSKYNFTKALEPVPFFPYLCHKFSYNWLSRCVGLSNDPVHLWHCHDRSMWKGHFLSLAVSVGKCGFTAEGYLLSKQMWFTWSYGCFLPEEKRVKTFSAFSCCPSTFSTKGWLLTDLKMDFLLLWTFSMVLKLMGWSR